MEIDDLDAIAEGLPYESRLGYIAFCVDRCLKEAQRHPVAARQLEQLPLLRKGFDLLWDRAERGIEPSRGDVERIKAHLDTYASYDPENPDEGAAYNYDVALVWAAKTLLMGLALLEDPDKPADYVVDAPYGIDQIVGAVYEDWEAAQQAEDEIGETALMRLRDWGSRPFSREVFDGIPDWDRGEISEKYASGRVIGQGGKFEEED
jgi:hypothetical protein